MKYLILLAFFFLGCKEEPCHGKRICVTNWMLIDDMMLPVGEICFCQKDHEKKEP